MPKNTSISLINSLNLPYFETIKQLAKLTGMPSDLLYLISTRKNKNYSLKFIPKRNHTLREISIPSPNLLLIQRWILENILNKLSPSDQAMAFRKGDAFGHKQNAYYHAATLYGLSIDLKDFFPSITANQVYNVFSNLGYSSLAATILTNFCTLNDKLPQGSACSPALSNLVCIRLDRRLSGLCQKHRIKYTRYADDMYFSGNDKMEILKIFDMITKIIEDEGFVINQRKIHIHTPSNRKQITGVIASLNYTEGCVELKAPRQLKQKIRSEIFACLISGDYQTKQHILGEINYVDFVEKENNLNYLERIKKYIVKKAEKIKMFPELVLAYNANKFFDDLPTIVPKKINIHTEEDLKYYSYLYKERKYFMDKNELVDICQYANWPDEIIN